MNDWTCTECDRPGACEICERCEVHCVARAPNDLAAHYDEFDAVIASTGEVERMLGRRRESN